MSPTFARFDDALIDMNNTDQMLLAAVVKANVRVITPPPELVQSIDASLNLQDYTPVTPLTVSMKLRVSPLCISS